MLLVLIIFPITVLSANVYHVSPLNRLASCRLNAECHTLNYYGMYSGQYFTNDTIFYFVPGVHVMPSQTIKISGVRNLTLEGLGELEEGFHETVIQSTSIIECDVYSFGGFVISDSMNVSVRKLTFQNCSFSWDLMYVSVVLLSLVNVTVDRVSIQQRAGVGLYMENCFYFSISNSSFAPSESFSHDCSLACPSKNVVINYVDFNSILLTSVLPNPQEYAIIYESHIINSNVSFAYSPGAASGFEMTLNNNRDLYGIQLVLDSSKFYRTQGSLSSNLAIYIRNNIATYIFKISDCSSTYAYYTNIPSPYSLQPYGNALTFVDESTQHIDKAILSISNSNFSYNKGIYFGGIFITFTEYNELISVSFDSCSLQMNSGLMGAGLYFSFPQTSLTSFAYPSLTLHNTLLEGSYVFSSASYNVHLDGFFGSLIIFNTFAKLGRVTIQRNELSGIIASSSKIHFFLNNTIQYNSGELQGGGIALYESSVLKLDHNSILFIKNNHATKYGGGVYINSKTTFDNPLQKFCFFELEHSLNNKAQVIMNGNEALVGDEIYGPSDMTGACLNDTVFVYDINSSQSVISSEAIKICLCNKTGKTINLINSNCDKIIISGIPGELKNVSLTAIGIQNGVTEGDISVTDTHTIQYMKIQPECTDLTYMVYAYSSVYEVHFQLNTATTSLVAFIVTVHTLQCPPGFVVDAELVCDCDPALVSSYGVKCDINSQLITRDGNIWLKYDTDTNCTIAHLHCPFDYCENKEIQFDISKPDPQCALNRSGILCGECAEGLSLMLGSNRCGECKNTFLSLITIFAFAGIALVIFLIALNLTVSVGTINGLIFYANVVKLYESVFFPNAPIPFFSQFMSWINLDLGIETCFYTGLDPFQKTFLQFAFPFYLWFLIAIIIYVCRKSSLASRYMGTSAVPVLATVILLSYMKLLRTIVLSLHLTELSIIGCDNEGVKIAWYVDANVSYDSPKHLVLVTASIVILVFLWIPYMLLLMISPLIEKYFSRYKLFSKWFKLKPVFDAYNGPYEDRYRFWTSVLLLSRLVLLLVVSFTDTHITLPVLSSLVAILLMLSVSFRGVYQKLYLNFLESWSFLNLIFMAGMASQSSKYAELGTIISGSLIFITFALITTCHFYSKFIKNKPWVKQIRKRISPLTKLHVASTDIEYRDSEMGSEFEELIDSEDISVSAQTSTVLHLRKREPLIFDDTTDEELYITNTMN